MITYARCRIVFCIVVLITLFLIMPSHFTALCEQRVLFPDPAFETKLREIIEKPKGELTKEDVEHIDSLSLDGCFIKDLTGIELFTDLKYLSCCYNELTSIDLSANTELLELYCDCNDLTQLDLSRNVKLRWLSCPDNALTSLDLSQNPCIEEIYVCFNQLSELNTDSNPLLTYLQCEHNQISSLDFCNNPLLHYLHCDSNQLTSVNVSGNELLDFFDCSYNQLTELDVSHNINLTVLGADGNCLKTLDVSNNILLTGLWCADNQIHSLDISELSLLSNFGYEGNESIEITTGDKTPSKIIRQIYDDKVENEGAYLDAENAQSFVDLRTVNDEPQFVVGNLVTFGTYQQKTDNMDPTPIEWLVLDRDGSKVLLISRYGLDVQPYHGQWTKVTWETCSLREWLNNTFFNEAFDPKEQEAILTTDIDNSIAQGYSKYVTDGGNDTQDKLFLLSYAEANKYFGVDGNNIGNEKAAIEATGYALQQGATTGSIKGFTEGKEYGSWWLRSPGMEQEFVYFVNDHGALWECEVCLDEILVRPAIWLDLHSDIQE